MKMPGLDIDAILSGAIARIVNDKDIPNQLTLDYLLSLSGKKVELDKQVVKGPRKTTHMRNPCFKFHILSNPRDPDSKAHYGTLLVNFHADNHPDGNVNVELLSLVAARLVWLFDEDPIPVPGWSMFDFYVEEPLGPLQDPAFPDEAFMSIRIRYKIAPDSLI